MAIQFNANALSAFSSVGFGQDDAIANLGEGNALVQKGNRGLGVLAKFRSGETQTNNNAVRSELLKALGQAFNLNGIGEQGGRTTFSREFMDRLEEILGPAFKRGDFGIDADGAVASGKPLTKRRITAIVNAACVKGDAAYDGKTYMAKVDSIADSFKGRGMKNFTSVVAVREYLGTIRKTIDFLENGMGGFDESCANCSLEEIKDFVFRNTRMTIFPKDIDNALEREGAADNGMQRLDRIKNYIRERLQTVVKTSVDLCLEANDTGKLVDIMDVAYRSYYRVEETLLALKKFTQPQLDQ